ncbi:DUF2590 family protein [Deinococcus cellulosilyticus]|uniref:IraD/Gp25-like domain-containing protein n=1 Tax=Deinococcus cellulosilyticus (strain DSM 18568 / NBRC 106333 / KACC 11606 / 5516J-15) TaxID=1223518 RepID=A0A511NB52_DEIC1|nr:DUF2590 family protein [Deinococcus cellulosilyticus]GEM50034.1 hypothetical protein DC3_56690 [Deinococcus cellulosilyticus NBRC 106333 = KACC 11606]
MIQDLLWENGDIVLDSRGQPVMISDADVVVQDLKARLLCPKGAHWAHPAAGFDLLPYVQGKLTDLTILELEQEIELECQNDARVRTADCQVTVLGPGRFQVAVVVQLTDQTLIEFGLTLGALA